MTTPTKRPVVVVLGMPRSGTSLLANMIHVLGVDLGQNLLWANENNPEGYWRTRSSPRSSSRFSSGRVCSNVPANSVLPVPPRAEPSPEFRAAKEQLIEVVARELNQAPGLWGFKDSRTSRLLPIWDRSVHGAGVGTALPPGTSQPLAVAASMAKLWETSPGLAQLMWITHNLEVLTSTRTQSLRMVVGLRPLVHTPPRAACRAGEGAGAAGRRPRIQKTVSAAMARIKPDLRHNHGDLSGSLPWVAETYALLPGGRRHRRGFPDPLVDRRTGSRRQDVHHPSQHGWIARPVVSRAAREREKRIDKLDKMCREQAETVLALDRQCREQANSVAALDRLCRETGRNHHHA
jgi:hypothetical protein